MSKKLKPISEIMSRTLCTVTSEQTAIDALARMRSKSVSSVLVTDGDATRGIITERDVVRALHQHGNLKTMSCAQLMQSPVVSVSPDTTCLHAYHLMTERGFRHMAVADETGRVVGLSSEGDLMRDFGVEYYMNFKDVGHVMRTDACMLPAQGIVADALEQMIEHKQSCVVVVDERQLPLGILTERDVVRLCSDHDRSELLNLQEVMIKPVRTVQAGLSLHQAVDLMRQAHIRRLVVVDAQGAVCGLLTHHEVVHGLEADYSDYFQELADLQAGRGQAPEGVINEKLILATVFRSATGTAVIAADLDYRIGHVTAAVAGVLGLDAADLIGQDLRVAFAQAGWPDAESVLREAALADGAQSFEATLGQERTLLRVLLMRTGQNQPCGFLALVQRPQPK